MHLTPWKPISFCSALIFNKGRRKGGKPLNGSSSMPTVLKELQELKLREALEEASEDGILAKSQSLLAEDEEETTSLPPDARDALLHSRTLIRLKAQRDFLAATAQAAERFFDNEESIVGLDEAFAKFKRMYPNYETTEKIDELRIDEYGHLEDTLKVCLDYCGFGLFSYLQQFEYWESSSFGLSEVSSSLSSHALNGIPEEGTLEHGIRCRIMDYLSVPENEYSMVFTVSRGSAFKLLADSYPFHQSRRLLTMYDYESESVNWMAQGAREKGAKIHSAWFKWPTLRLCNAELKKLLERKKKRKRDSASGLFVFPVQSRVTGAKYSYQWMSLAQQHKWHVLLDAGALGPKDMDSLGLSLFRPDFIITSFYKVFGSDPTGFGCLFIKNTALGCLQNKVTATGSGMVRIVPALPPDPMDCADGHVSAVEEGEDEIVEDDDCGIDLQGGGNHLPAFSGPFSSVQVRDVFENEMDYDNSSDRDGTSTACDDTDDFSVEEIMKSPVSSEEENGNLMCIDLGDSPGIPHVSDNARQGPNSKLGLRQLHDGLSRRNGSTGEKKTEGSDGPIPGKPRNSQGTKGGVISFDAAVSSVSQEFSTEVASNTFGSSLASETTAGSVNAVQELPKASKTHSSLANGGSSEKHESSEGHKSLLKSEASSSTKRNSQRFQKQTRITFNLDNEDTASAKADEQRGHSLNLDRGTCSTGETSHSVCNEITSADDDCNNADDSRHVSGSRERRKLAESSKQNQVENRYGAKESCIRRETEGAFRLLGRREEGKFSSSRFLGLDEERINGSGRRVPYSLEEQSGEDSESAYFYTDDAMASAGEAGDDDDQYYRGDPQIMCKHLDHVDELGLNKTTLRLRYLINWLVTSLLQLRHPAPEGSPCGIPVVHIYGPKIKYDRGAAVAFNIFGNDGSLVNPELVQRLAEKSKIYLGLGFLSHLRLMDNCAELREAFDSSNASFCKPMANGRLEGKNVTARIEVVTASLGFLTNFEDVYRLWSFAARFLNADFAKGDGNQ
eukprot:TRINITY_DN21730_c0_g1_i1.p1 TRINITY_DN21730_c0_g1~~TRINITY_DN21730_c0_g1_i1.p1  ORF type:complete len:1015 (-),score=241.37 TRINITY_DN21730_c0_g1_i1:172-3216(-)